MTDQELIGYLDKIRAEIRQTRIALEEENRLTRVTMEEMRSEVQLVAEGVIGFGERLEVHKNEVLLKFDEVKGSIAPYYLDLHRRVSHLEAKADRWDRDVIEVMREKLGKR